MSNKQMKRIRKLRGLFGYTPPMYRTMKKVVKGFNQKNKAGFAKEVDALVVAKKPKVEKTALITKSSDALESPLIKKVV